MTGYSEALSPYDYTPASVSRACAKTYLGNLCRRDWRNAPQITCISTCDRNFCNCDTRSPPPAMFEGGKVAFESPKNALFYSSDYASCKRTNRSSRPGENRRGANRVPVFSPHGHRMHEHGSAHQHISSTTRNSIHMGTFVIICVIGCFTSSDKSIPVTRLAGKW